MELNVGRSLLATVFAVILIWLFGMFASTIIYGSSGFLMFLVGAVLAFSAGFGAIVIPVLAFSKASTLFVVCGLCSVIALHYLYIFSHINLFSETTLAYFLAFCGSAFGGVVAALTRDIFL